MTTRVESIDREPFDGGKQAMLISLAVALVGLALCIVGWVVAPRQTFAAYLIAYEFVATVMIGVLAFVMAAHAMDAAWPTVVRRLAEAVAGAMPLLAVLFVPLFFSLKWLYPWMHPLTVHEHHTRELLEHKLPMMNQWFFDVRAAFYVLTWTAIAFFLRFWSRRMDRPGGPNLHPRLKTFSALTLPLLGATGTFAAFDWMMSLSPDFYSTMYGLYVLAGGFVGSLGLMVLLMFIAQREGRLVEVNRSHWYAMGRLLFAFLIFWAYTGFFQYLLIWIGNKPLEVKFYLERIQPGDRWTSWFLVWGHFAVPWLILLSYFVKRHRATVTALGSWLVFCHYVDIHWLVGAHRGAAPWQWEDAPAIAFVGGASVAFALWRQRGRLLAAVNDPWWEQAVEYESR